MAVAVAAQGRAATTVDDDHGTGLEATLLPIGQPLAGTLSDADDLDAFRIDLTGAARVEVRTSGGTDTRGRLLDSSGGVRARDDDSGPGGHNFRIVAALEPDVYYLEVVGAAGDYSVVAVLADAPDQGDTAAASTPLALHDRGPARRRAGDAARCIRPHLAVRRRCGRLPPGCSIRDLRDRSKLWEQGPAGAPGAQFPRDLIGRPGRGHRHRFARQPPTSVRWLAAGTYYVVVGGDEVGAYRLLATRGRGPSCWNARLTFGARGCVPSGPGEFAGDVDAGHGRRAAHPGHDCRRCRCGLLPPRSARERPGGCVHERERLHARGTVRCPWRADRRRRGQRTGRAQLPDRTGTRHRHLLHRRERRAGGARRVRAERPNRRGVRPPRCLTDRNPAAASRHLGSGAGDTRHAPRNGWPHLALGGRRGRVPGWTWRGTGRW